MTRQVLAGPKRGTGKTRALVLRHAKAGLTRAEIAKRCGISREAVRKHLKRLIADGDLRREAS